MRFHLVPTFLLTSIALMHGAAQARHLPSPTGVGIARGQTFDRSIENPAVYKGQVYFIWGSNEPKNAAPAVGSKYLPSMRDLDRSHTLDWYKKNHPEWVEYKADRVTPAYGFVYAHGTVMPIDISNTEVRKFYWDTYIQPAIDAGYPMIALDNVDLVNGAGRAGHYDKRGEWVQQFSGEKGNDPAYVAAVVDWIRYVSARLHRAGIGVAANITYPLTRPELEPSTRALIESVDVWCDEQGFTHHSDDNVRDAVWDRKFNFVRSLQGKQIYWAVNETTTKHLADATEAQIDYAVANYYLYRERNSLLTICGSQEYGVFLDTPDMHINLGKPLESPQHSVSGAWTRRYSKGMVIVNPYSASSTTVTLPKGVWVDSHGKKLTNVVEVAPVQAIIAIAN